MAIPALILFGYTSYTAEMHTHHQKRPEFVQYPHMYKRDKVCGLYLFVMLMLLLVVSMGHQQVVVP